MKDRTVIEVGLRDRTLRPRVPSPDEWEEEKVRNHANFTATTVVGLRRVKDRVYKLLDDSHQVVIIPLTNGIPNKHVTWDEAMKLLRKYSTG